MPSLPKLSLYHYDTCFYCRVVRDAIDELGMDVELRDVRADRQYREQLIAARGRKTVPVLRIELDRGDVQWMPESRYIVGYLRRLNAGAPEVDDPTSEVRAAERVSRIQRLAFLALIAAVLGAAVLVRMFT